MGHDDNELLRGVANILEMLLIAEDLSAVDELLRRWREIFSSLLLCDLLFHVSDLEGGRPFGESYSIAYRDVSLELQLELLLVDGLEGNKHRE